MKKPPTKLPVVSTPTPAQTQRGLVVAPVPAGSRPEFPTRSDLYRKAGLIGSATLLASGLAAADAPAKKQDPPPHPQQAEQASIEDGSINGRAIPKAAPKFKVYREGGGIGPAEDMWKVEDIEAFVSWTMAKEGRLAIQTNYKLELDGVSLTLDGFDPVRNVGYEYIDPHDPKRSQYTPAVRAKLDAWIKDKKVAILLLDTKRYPDAATLKGKVIKFLYAIKKAPPATGTLAPAAKK